MTRSFIRPGNTVRASLNNDCMTNRHDERQWDDNYDAMTETDSDITRGYNAGTRDYGGITRSYRREREGVGTIGLDWLGRGWREGSGKGRGIPAGLVPLASPFPHSSPHSPLPQSHPSPHSTSI